MGATMNKNGEDVEARDGEKLKQALALIKQNDMVRARQLLEDIVEHTPGDYAYQYEDEERLVIKFWDQDEFVEYVAQLGDRRPQKDIVWMNSVYPRAYYFLAFIDVHEKKYEDALKHIDAALMLEPDQPLCFCEKAVIYSALGQHDQALELYEQALQVRATMTNHQRAAALRGKGLQRIELGRLDEAEESFRESLKYEPTSKVAKNELLYIAQLRSKGRMGQLNIVATQWDQKKVCATCEREIAKGEAGTGVATFEGRTIYVCGRCHKKLTKRWWEFWK
jgi:tetratricopeptide (TPR) repeat protein